MIDKRCSLDCGAAACNGLGMEKGIDASKPYGIKTALRQAKQFNRGNLTTPREPRNFVEHGWTALSDSNCIYLYWSYFFGRGYYREQA